jgi:chromosomal replication initiator protein
MILFLASEYFDIEQDLLSAKIKTAKICKARQMAQTFLRNEIKLPFLEIGKLFKRDHSSIIHSVTTITNICSYDEDYRNEYLNFKLYCNKVISTLN